MNSDIKPDFEAIAKRFFPDTHTEKYYADGPHKILSKKWQSEQDEIEVHRRCFVYGYEKAYNESISTVKRLQETIKLNEAIIEDLRTKRAKDHSILQEENERYKEALKQISEENYNDDDKKRHLYAIIDRIKAYAQTVIDDLPTGPTVGNIEM